MIDQMKEIYKEFDLNVPDLQFDNDEYPVSTFYGREFEAPLIFYKCLTNIEIKQFICYQKLMIDLSGGLENLVSDHFPVVEL